MKLHTLSAPFLRRERTAVSMMGDAFAALAALLILPTVYFGPRALVLALVSMTACAAFDILACLIFRHTFGSGDPSALVTGLTIALLLPVNAPYWLPVLAGAFAILVVKMPLGFTGRNLFNPAAAGVAFVTVCQPDPVFLYANPTAGWLDLANEITVVLGASPGSALLEGLKPSIMPHDLLWGVYPGPMGCTAALVIGAGALLLLARRTIRWEPLAFFLLTTALVAALFPRIYCTALTSVKYELLTGSLLFCAVFLLGDPVTSPRTITGRCAFGVLAGALLMGMRHAGAYEQTACFAVLIANAFSPVLDRAVIAVRRKGVRLP